jgi:hypothetical protein
MTMARDIEHSVETHRLAQQRRAAGRPVWDLTINLADFWNNEDLTFEQRRDKTVERIRQSPWFTEYDEDSSLHALVEELADAADGDEFDGPWEEIFDLADIDGVWIATS